MNSGTTKFRRNLVLSFVILLVVFFSLGIPAATGVMAQTSAGEGTSPQTTQASSSSGVGLIAAGLAFGLGALGAGIAIGNIGAAAMGAISEKPEIAGNALIFIALAEGLMVFGFIIALMILGKV
jgi:V/A-type H+-transporting ATPase subunit K